MNIWQILGAIAGVLAVILWGLLLFGKHGTLTGKDDED